MQRSDGSTNVPNTSSQPGDAHRAVPRVSSRELMRHQPELIIEHAGREYRLRITHSGKLILTA